MFNLSSKVSNQHRMALHSVLLPTANSCKLAAILNPTVIRFFRFELMFADSPPEPQGNKFFPLNGCHVWIGVLIFYFCLESGVIPQVVIQNSTIPGVISLRSLEIIQIQLPADLTGTMWVHMTVEKCKNMVQGTVSWLDNDDDIWMESVLRSLCKVIYDSFA